MKRLLAVALVLCAVPLFADGVKKPKIVKAKKKIPNSWIVVLEDRVDVDAAAQDLTGLSRGQLKHVYKTALRGFAADMSDADAMPIAADPLVEYVEGDSEVKLDTTDNGAALGLCL